MNGLSIKSHQARLALALMLLIMADEDDTSRQRYHDCPFTRTMRVQYYLNGHDKDLPTYTRMKPESFLHLCGIL